jgi:hypothetical protein
MENNTNTYNNHYKTVNSKIEEYIKGHKVSPKNLKKYFNSKKIEELIKRIGLEGVKGIKTIVNDVIDDWYSIEKDGVMKFERFIINEDMGNIKIEKSGQTYEKVLADLYRTSVGHIEVISDDEHKYKVNDMGQEINVIIYSEADLIKFKREIIPILSKTANESQIDIHKTDVGLTSGKEIKTGISFNLQEVVDEKKLSQYFHNILRKEKVLQIVTSFINDYDILSRNTVYNYKKEYNKYYIWELNSKKSVTK